MVIHPHPRAHRHHFAGYHDTSNRIIIGGGGQVQGGGGNSLKSRHSGVFGNCLPGPSWHRDRTKIPASISSLFPPTTTRHDPLSLPLLLSLRLLVLVPSHTFTLVLPLATTSSKSGTCPARCASLPSSSPSHPLGLRTTPTNPLAWEILSIPTTPLRPVLPPAPLHHSHHRPAICIIHRAPRHHHLPSLGRIVLGKEGAVCENASTRTTTTPTSTTTPRTTTQTIRNLFLIIGTSLRLLSPRKVP